MAKLNFSIWWQNLLSKRFILGLMMLLSMVFSFMIRGSMSITITSMTYASKIGNYSNETVLPDYGPRYNWPAYEQGILLGSYFYGYIISNIPGGYVSELMGARALVGYSSMICGIISVVTPVLVPYFWILFISQFAIGFFAGFLLPALMNLIAYWSPPDEKAKFTTSLGGGSLGLAISWPICGMIIELLGWPAVFYIIGGMSLAFTALWFATVYNNPAKHPTISNKEREYIESKVTGISQSAKNVPPYWSILKSIPFWSLVLIHYGNAYGTLFILTAAPKFLNEVIGFQIGKAGFLSMLPNLCRFFTPFLFGLIDDYMRNKNWFSVTCTRKLFCITSHIIPGLLFFTLIFVNTEPYYCVAIMTLALAFNGSAVLTNLQNSQDLSPNYAGTVYGLMNSIGTTAGFVSPLVVAYFTQENNTIKEWNNIFIIGGLVYIIPALIYMVFGSGEVQQWNEPRVTERNETTPGVDVVIYDANVKEDRKDN